MKIRPAKHEMINFRVDKNTKLALQKLADKNGMSISDLLRDIVQIHLNNELHKL